MSKVEKAIKKIESLAERVEERRKRNLDTSFDLRSLDEAKKHLTKLLKEDEEKDY